MAPPSPKRSHSPGHQDAQKDASTHGLVMLPRTEKKEAAQTGQPGISIPKIKPLESRESLSTRARGLVGKFVDEFGNILGWDGTVLGSVEGDLPSMVGRPISESGEVLDGSGEVVGYVSENHANPPLKNLQGGLKMDESGNIYNRQGVVVGKMHGAPAPADGASGRQPDGKAQDTGSSGSPSNSDKAAKPSPSDVFLDIKSTYDGIQLTIRIPTCFNREK